MPKQRFLNSPEVIVDDINRLHSDLIWHPPWSPEMMDSEMWRQGFRRPVQYA